MISSLLIAIVICIDSFVLGLSYGMKNVRISKLPLLIISSVTVCVLSASMFLGTLLMKILPGNLTTILSFIIFVTLGSYCILKGHLKYLITRKRNQSPNNELAQIKLSNLDIEICINAIDETPKAEVTNNINSKEALYLGFALSLDSLGVGFGSSLGNINYFQMIVFAFVLNTIVIPLGLAIGRRLVCNTKNIKSYWISGGILIALGISKLT